MKRYQKIIFYPVRFVIQFIFYVVEWIVFACDRFVYHLISCFIKPEYTRLGSCGQTGTCCKKIGLHVPWFWVKFPWLIRLVTKWHYLRYNFNFLGQVDNCLVYECLYLGQNNKCQIQSFKPKLCRDFPIQKLVGKVDLYEGCGFCYVPTKSLKFEKAMRQAKKRRKL